MIPIRDDVLPRRPAVVVLVLIALCGLVFLRELQLLAHAPRGHWNELLGLPGPLDALLARSALVPERVAQTILDPLDAMRHPIETMRRSAAPLVTSLFLHAGWGHLLSNAWFLWVFGRSVEARLGPARFAVAYLGAGVAAGVLHVLLLALAASVDEYAWHAGIRIERYLDRLAVVANEALFSGRPGLPAYALSQVPTLGASGAISGILGAHLVTCPRARVVAIVPPLFFLPFELPALLFAGLWLVTQVFELWASLGQPLFGDVGGVAYGAHLGGFVSGLGLGAILRRPRREPDLAPIDIR